MLFYGGSCPGKLLAWEGIRTFFRGTVILNGVTYEVTPETSYGYADKHWGRSYNQPWLQFASGHLISEKTVVGIEAFGSRHRRLLSEDFYFSPCDAGF